MEAGDPCSRVEEEAAAEDETNEEFGGGEEQALLFLDSLDGYLTLLDALSSALRQGWLELASARHSMGSSRVSTSLLDLKERPAATTVILNELHDQSLSVPKPHFELSKWACLEEKKSTPVEVMDGKLLEDRGASQLRHRGSKLVLGTTIHSESAAVDVDLGARSLMDKSSAAPESTSVDENKQRYKQLSVFGAFVSPKLRAAQFSFETALEIVVEIANMRSAILSSFSQLQKVGESSG